MPALVQNDKYGSVNTKYTVTMGYYAIKSICKNPKHYNKKQCLMEES